MKVGLNVILNAPNDFTCGNCKKCPIHQEAYYSTHQYEETKISCPLGYNSVSCPLEPQTECSNTPEPDDFALTDAEKIICKMYLKDLDKTGGCNEYKLLMRLIESAKTSSENKLL